MAFQSDDKRVGLDHQSHLPVGQRREEFTPEEQRDIERESRKILPKIFLSMGDRATADLSSPGWGAAMGGLSTGVLGAGIGAWGGAAATNGKPGGVAGGAAIGGVLGSLLGAFGGYFGTKADNESVTEMMRYQRPGATRREMLSDPVIQSEMNRQTKPGNFGAGLTGGLVGGMIADG